MAIIVVSEAIDRMGLEILSHAGDVHYDERLWNSPDNLFKWVAGANALVIRNQMNVTAELLDRAPHVKVIGRLGVGVDNIDLRAAHERGVTVVTARGANAMAVAEYVFAVLFYFSRQLHLVDQSVRRGEWNRSLGGFELHGKTLGLIGLGDIGQRMAFRARNFGLRVVAFDPWQLTTHMAAMDMGVALKNFDEVFESADFVSVHVPLIESTRGLVDAGALARMKPGSYFINTSRGGIVDEEALLKAVQTGQLAGAALDVRTHEPSPSNDALYRESRILLTPHISGLTAEAGMRTATTVAEDVVRVLSGQPPMAAV